MRRANFFYQHIIVFTIMFFITNCGSSLQEMSSETTSATNSPSTTEEITSSAIGGEVSTLKISDGVSDISFSDLSEDDEVLLMLYAVNDTSGASSFQIGASENLMFLQDGDVAASEGDEVTTDLHGLLRSYESQLDEEALLEDKPTSKHLIKMATVGQQKTFKVLNSFSSSSNYDSVTATLRYTNDEFEIYVDNRNSKTMDTADLEEIAAEFTSVLPLEREVFGTESDVDGNGKFAVLLTQTVNELGGSVGGMVTGFFYAVDLFSSDQYSISNEMEVYYTFVPDELGEFGSAVSKEFAMTNIYPGVLAHEFQHMINFNMHYNVNGGSMEQNWVNEGLSHLAEDIYSHDADGYMVSTGLENPARVSSYLSEVNSICFTCGTSLKERGGAYLFFRYLYEQAELGNLPAVGSGNELLTTLLDTDLRGSENVVRAAYGLVDEQEGFGKLLGLFGLAVYLSNTDSSDDDRFGFTGINLRSAQDDNRGTVLSGPAIQSLTKLPFVDSLSGNGITYIQMSGKDIMSNGGALSLEFGSNTIFGGYMIQE